ncbi:MAG: hypothetical protein IJV40_03500 [Oscillospiraceae bacterium]|nr:hypothetical protein [Oscillospiraceae bacterium]
MFVYVDGSDRITAYNPNDMSGNTGWYQVQETIGDPITEEHGVPIYKYRDGHVVSRSRAEIEADIPEPVPVEPSEIEVLRMRIAEQQEQLTEQADALIELAELIGG